MAHTFPELKSKPLAELREIAAGIEHEAVKGYTQLNKDHLLAALCKALNIDMHVHHEVKGVDKTAIIHVPVGKISFSADQLEDNASSLINAVRKAKPPAAKGKYVRSIYVSSTMSPSIQIDPAVAEVKAE